MALAVSFTSSPSKLRSRNACCWRGGSSASAGLQHADRLVELEAFRRRPASWLGACGDRIEFLVVFRFPHRAATP